MAELLLKANEKGVNFEIDAENNKGETATERAIKIGYPTMITLFKSYHVRRLQKEQEMAPQRNNSNSFTLL